MAPGLNLLFKAIVYIRVVSKILHGYCIMESSLIIPSELVNFIHKKTRLPIDEIILVLKLERLYYIENHALIQE